MKIIDQYKGLRREIYVLFVCKLIDNAGSMIGPMFTLILSEKMGLDGKSIAILLSLFTFVSMPMQLLGGKLGDRLNKKLLINIFDILTSSIYIICGIVGLNSGTLVLYMFGSFLQYMESPIYDSLIADFTTSADRDKAYSLDYVGLNLGLALAPTIGGLLLKNYLWLMFVISGISEALSVIVFDIFIKDIKVVVDDSNIYEAKNNSDSIMNLFKEKKVLFAILFVFSLGTFAYSMYAYLMPLTLIEAHGDLGSVYYGTMSSVNCIVVFTCTAFITNLLSKINSINKMIIAEGLQLFGYLIFVVFVGKSFFYYPSIIIFTLGEIVNTISISPYLTKRIPINFRSRMLSVFNVVGTAFQCIGEIIVGDIYDRTGYVIPWIITFVVIILMIVLFNFIKEKDKKYYPDLYKNNNA